MRSQKRVVPRWWRTVAKIGIVLFILLGVATALTGNWVAAGGMLVFTVLEVTMLITTKSAS